jgi:hypothetical protein
LLELYAIWRHDAKVSGDFRADYHPRGVGIVIADVERHADLYGAC